mmetsp:Transcript_32295/g.100311  ORF Transcript_32295/g.100311 Transcript_32295/m.100311 type:complete len:297 (-) Transcript_32295:1093-1983(-)
MRNSAADLVFRLRVDRPCGDSHNLASRGRVGTVGGEDVHLGITSSEDLHPVLCCCTPPHLLHPVHLVAHNLPPIGSVLIRLHDCDVGVVILVEHQRRAAPLVVDDGHAPVLQLVAAHDHAQRCQRGRVVLDNHAVVYAKNSTVLHVPPADLIDVREVISRVERAVGLHDVATIILLRRVGGEPQVVVVVRMLVRVGDNGAVHLRVAEHREVTDITDIALVRIGHGGIEPDLAALGMVHSANLETSSIASQKPRLAPPIPRGARGHHRRLRKDARAAVVSAGEGDGVLVIVGQVEMP